MSLPLNEKYRPKELSQVLGNEKVRYALQRIAIIKEIPHLLFYGPPGTGKTSAIRALAAEIYGSHITSNVLELNASDDRGIETVRNSIKNFAETKSFGNQTKLIVLDEADSMSRDAQNCMRRVIEDYSKNARFCLIANYSSKIIPAIQSRCTKFRFSPVSDNKIKNKILDICGRENVKCCPLSIDMLIKNAQGDMRRLLNDIEGIKNGFGEINTQNVYTVCGGTDPHIFQHIFESVQKKSFPELKATIAGIKKSFNLDCDTILTNLSEFVASSEMTNKLKILKDLSDIQIRIAAGCSEDIQASAILASFVLNR